jgi:hypothetical protein
VLKLSESDLLEGDLDGLVRADAAAFVAVLAQELGHYHSVVLHPDGHIRAHLHTKGLGISPAHRTLLWIYLGSHF